MLGIIHDDGLRAIRAGDYVSARGSLEESLERARVLGARDEICDDVVDLGVLALCERRFEDALSLYGESLPLARQSSSHVSIAWGIWGIGCCLSAAGDVNPAARLFGAAEALLERLGEPIEDYALRAYAEGSAPVRDRLGEVDLAQAWASGRALSEADAATYAGKAVTERRTRA